MATGFAFVFCILWVHVPVPLHHFHEQFLHLLPHVRGFQHFHFVSLREEFLQEVEGGAEAEFEVGMVGGAPQFFLRVVQGQCTQVVGEGRIGPDHHAFGLVARAAQHSVVVLEEEFRIEVPGVFEAFGGFLQREDAVQGIDGRFGSLGVLCQQVPAVLEHLDGIGCDGDGVSFSAAELAVCHFQLVADFHGVDDEWQVFVAGRDALEDDAVSQRPAFHEEVAHGEGVVHPVL